METSIQKTNAFYGTTPIDQMKIIKKEGDWDVDEANLFAKTITTNFFNELQANDKKVKLQLVYYFRDTNFFVSSRFFGDEQMFVEPSLENYDFDESLFTTVDMILINRVVLPTEGGCNDEKNDCLWKALKKALGSHLTIMPSTLKKHLKLSRNSLIDYKHIPKIEDKVKANINVVGDYELKSTKNYPHNCYVKLQANHYSYKPNHKIFDVLYSQPTAKTLLVYENHDENHFNCFDGVDFKLVKKTDLNNYCREHKYSCLKRTKFKYEKSITINKIFYDLIRAGEALKLSSGGLIDVKLNGYDYVKCAKNLFYNYCKSIEFETITKKEEDFLRQSKMCGMMFVEKNKKAHMKCYDFNQFYPFLLTRRNKYKLPTGQPEIVELNELPDILSFGLYKCKIDIPKNNKFMICNKNDVYTHYDLKVARDCNYKITLLKGENACLYKTKRMYPNKLFEEYMNLLLKCKNDKTKTFVKPLMNCLWGSLSQKNWQIHDLRKPLVLNDLKQVRIRVNANRQRVVADVIRKNTFKYPHARIASFITSVGRYVMYNTIKPFHEKVYRIHTDGFYCDSDVILETGTEMGQLKIEMEGVVEFHHLNKKTIF